MNLKLLQIGVLLKSKNRKNIKKTNVNLSSTNSYMANSKLFLTDNNYQSYQSSTSNYYFLLEKDW